MKQTSLILLFSMVSQVCYAGPARLQNSRMDQLGRLKVINQFLKTSVIHKTEFPGDTPYDDIFLEDTNIPDSLITAIHKIGQTQLGIKVFSRALTLKKRFTFVEVSKNTDPDMAIAFRVGFDELGPNAIHYTQDITNWKRLTLIGKPEKVGEEISTATLGSLISHEFGHTQIGLDVLNIKEDINSLNYNHKKDEFRAIKYFENSYRLFYKMPLRKTYFKINDAIQFYKDLN